MRFFIKSPIITRIYFYNLIILGTPQKAAATLASWNAITTVVNAIITIILSSSIYLIIRPRLIKNNLFY